MVESPFSLSRLLEECKGSSVCAAQWTILTLHGQVPSGTYGEDLLGALKPERLLDGRLHGTLTDSLVHVKSGQGSHEQSLALSFPLSVLSLDSYLSLSISTSLFPTILGDWWWSLD